MVCTVHTMSINGIQGNAVSVEAYITSGLPHFEIVGLPDAAVKESRERVRAAAKTAGFRFPTGRIAVNLAPASLRKAGSHYDLPILLSILAAYGVVRKPSVKWVFLGEVSLDGQIRPVSGVLPMALSAKRLGYEKLFVPAQNAAEATLARGPAVIPVHSVRELIDAINQGENLPAEPAWMPGISSAPVLDFKDVVGQQSAKRAMEIAAAGGHNILLIGPPGSGKSMISKRLPSILPDMTWNESLSVTEIYSVMGMLKPSSPLIQQRPFRSPHHTISNAGLIGGGTNPKPGEISLSHKGVLFLDELPEFKRDTLDLLRQPLEDGDVTIARVSGSVSYPAEFMLVCAMNPCKCGWYGDPSGRCTCSENAVEQYRSRISGPLLDRIDMIIEVPAVPFDDISHHREEEPSSVIRERVNAARKIQNARYGDCSEMTNSTMGTTQLRMYCQLDEQSYKMLKQAFETFNLTARSYDRILKVARTIADLAGSEQITTKHLQEAVQYRLVNI